MLLCPSPLKVRSLQPASFDEAASAVPVLCPVTDRARQWQSAAHDSAKCAQDQRMAAELLAR